MTAVLEINGLHTKFGSQVIHKDLDLTIEGGQIVAIIGGSGCGKSVLLKESLRLLRPSAGTIRLLGVKVWEAPNSEVIEVLRRVGVLFQNGALFSSLTVAENIAAPLLERTSLKRNQVEWMIETKLALAGLSSTALNKYPSELSGGMRKRVALARALVLEPTILFLDEPTSGLDPISARAFDALVRTLCDTLGITIILVTHDIDTLYNIVDRIVVLGGGGVLAQGSVEEVSRHKDPWVEEYFDSRAPALQK